MDNGRSIRAVKDGLPIPSGEGEESRPSLDTRSGRLI
jgi:hypothetical protein